MLRQPRFDIDAITKGSNVMTKLFRLCLPVFAAAVLVLGPAVEQAAAQATATPVKKPDVIFVPTPQVVVDKMLELAEVGPKDLVYDLGCGNGIIIVTAAKKGARAVGFDVDPQRIRETQENIKKNAVGDKARVMQKDIFTLDLSDANVVTLYLLPSLNVKLIPQLEKLKPGTRIVSHDFDMKGVKPEKVVTVQGPTREHTVYLWRAPLQKEKESE
jgi:SAM-dependent methyltransferase